MIKRETFVLLINEMIKQANKDARFGEMLEEFVAFPDDDLTYDSSAVFRWTQRALEDVFRDDKRLIDDFFESVLDPYQDDDWVPPQAEDLYDKLMANLKAREGEQE